MTFINISTLTTEMTGISANGNLLTGDGRTITWDIENRLTSVTKAGVTNDFVYDGDGKRVKQMVADGQTLPPFPSPLPFRLPYAYWKLITDNFSNLQYYLGGKQIALRKGGVLSYLHQDSLGSSSVTSNSAGAEVGRISYFPFGSNRSGTGTMPTDKLFTGQRLDSTGLYYYNARYYDPSIGRFISPDSFMLSPSNPQGLNRYTYAFNNPVKYNDPTGNWPPFLDKAISHGFTAVKVGLQVAINKTVAVYQTAKELPGKAREAAMHAVGITQVEYVQTSLVNNMPVYHLSESGLIGNVMDSLGPGAITVAPLGIFIRTEIYSSQELPQLISHESKHYAEQSTWTTPLWLAGYYGEMALDWAYYGGNYWTGPYAANSAEQRARNYAGQPEAPIHDPWWQGPWNDFTQSVGSYLDTIGNYYYNYYSNYNYWYYGY